MKRVPQRCLRARGTSGLLLNQCSSPNYDEAGFHGDNLPCKALLAGQPARYAENPAPPDGRPFQIDNGYGPRVFQHEKEARHPKIRASNAYKLNVIRSIGKADFKRLYEIDLVIASADEAYTRQAALIGLMKRLHEGDCRLSSPRKVVRQRGPA